ncbi:MAG: DUF2934 domain-containing protein [Steroidobacteraceae bacterium]
MSTIRTTRRRTAKKAPRPVVSITAAQPMATAPQPVEADTPREAMIAEAAYYRAENRGFTPGYELDDWLAAEAEITGCALQQESSARSGVQ